MKPFGSARGYAMCKHCHGAVLVGWSGAGPHLCKHCSEGEDPFTAITAAFRRERARVWELEHEICKLRSTD